LGRPQNLNKYNKVLKSLTEGCISLQKSSCKFIVIPCNTAHYWYDDLQKKIRIPIINMPKEVYLHTKKNCKKKSKIGLLATEGTLKTGVYNRFFDKNSLEFKGWETKDAYSNNVSFIISNLKTNKIIDNEFFKIPKEEDL